LQRLERCLGRIDLSDTDETYREVSVCLNHLGPIADCTRRPFNALVILLCDETRKGQHVVGIMTARVTRVQAQDLMQMLDGALRFAYSSFQIGNNS
jgi:hypothetical protein